MFYALNVYLSCRKDYVPGAPCKKEIELTDEILKVLDEFGSDFETDTAVSRRYLLDYKLRITYSTSRTYINYSTKFPDFLLSCRFWKRFQRKCIDH